MSNYTTNQADGVAERAAERTQAEAAYTLAAYNYPRDPVGSRDWTLYYGGWLHRAALAAQPAAPAEPVWKLTSPEGKCWAGETKLKCMAAELNDRVPASVQLERIFGAVEKSRADDERLCRETYDNTFHKITASIGYDDWHMVWFKALDAIDGTESPPAQAPAAPSVGEPRATSEMVEFQEAAVTEVEDISARLSALRNRLNALATPPAAPAATEAPSEYFAHSADNGTDWFKTAAEAHAAAQSELDYLRKEASKDGEWSETAEGIRWGVVLGKARAVDHHDEKNEAGEKSVDYVLATPAPAVGASPEPANCNHNRLVCWNHDQTTGQCQDCNAVLPGPGLRLAKDKWEEGYNAGRAGGISRPLDLHPATSELVTNFSDALRDKLYAAQEKYGYSDGWLQSDWMDECRAKLLEHVAKGDPRDVAAYCAFLWHHRESTAFAVGASVQPVLASLSDALQRIVDWRLPRVMIDGRSCSYGTAYGSNGERDYMRAVAKGALDALATTSTAAQPGEAS